MVRLSIIVPVYNAELYIERCIRSLFDQDISWNDYEVICVDDYSLDKSSEIIETLQKIFPTLKLLKHTENKRQGGARNTGLRAAVGRYVWFVDSDDTIFPNVLHTLLVTAEVNNLDVLQFDYTRKEEKIYPNDIKKSPIQTGEKYLFDNVSIYWYDKLCAPWRQLLRKQFLLDNKLNFIENVQFEDTDYMLQIFLQAKIVQHISIVVYYYHYNVDSVTLSRISPVSLAWRVNQIMRCYRLNEIATTVKAHSVIREMVSNTLLQLRKELKHFSLKQKIEYTNHLSANIKECRVMMSWRTWLAIRYGITWFI